MVKKKNDEDDDRDDAGDDDEPEEDNDDSGEDNKDFNDFSSIFPANFSEYMNKFMKQFLKNFNPETLARLQKDLEKQMRDGGPVRPAVFGFSMGVGPDGKPIVNPFGNVQQRQGKPEVKEVRDPMVDIVDDKDELIVVAEVPGVQKEDIVLSATETTLSIQAKSADKERNYEKVVDLPAKINPKIAKARYTNGILEVRLQKIEPRKQSGASIPVE